MSEQTQKALSLDLASFAICSVPGTQPVAILNEASSQLGKLLYCERAVVNLSMAASVCEGHDNLDVRHLAVVFFNQLEPWSQMLGHLVAGAETLEGA